MAVSTKDESLIRALQKGDEKALETLIERYTSYVGTVVWNIVGRTLSKSDAEEIIADVFISLWKNARSTDGRRLKGYLGKIARNKSIDALRRAGSDLSLEDDILLLEQPGPEQVISQSEEAKLLRHTLENLPEPDKTIFIRHYYLYQPTVKIAADMQLNINTVQSKLRRGRDKLRKILEEGGFEHE